MLRDVTFFACQIQILRLAKIVWWVFIKIKLVRQDVKIALLVKSLHWKEPQNAVTVRVGATTKVGRNLSIREYHARGAFRVPNLPRDKPSVKFAPTVLVQEKQRRFVNRAKPVFIAQTKTTSHGRAF